jgi:hypothetical protein
MQLVKFVVQVHRRGLSAVVAVTPMLFLLEASEASLRVQWRG